MTQKEKKPPFTIIGETQPAPFYLQYIENLTEARMVKTIAKEFLRFEETHYRNGWVFPAEAKLLFLVGTDEIDVTKAKTSNGIPIYTKTADHVKAPEIVEAISAISDHFEREQNVPNVLLEIADVWYNLVQLTQLDTDFAPTYQKCIDELCSTLGYSRREAYKLVVLKYKVRFIDKEGGKSHSDERKEIVSQLRGEHSYHLPTPTDASLNDAYRLLNKMSATILRPRLLQLRTLQAWKQAAWYPATETWETRRGDPDFPGMYMNKSTVRLLQIFKDTVHPDANVVMQPILARWDDADMSLSSIFPNTRFITRSLPLADTLVHIGFKTYRQNPLRFKPQQEIDILWLNANREVLLKYVRDGGYVIQSVGNAYIQRHDYKPIGVLTFDRYSGNPLFDTRNPWEYRMRVETDAEFQEVSDILARDAQESPWKLNGQTDIPASFSGLHSIRFSKAADIVHDVTGESSNIVEQYKRILKQYREEGSNENGPLHQVFKRHDVIYTSLPNKRYGLGEMYFVFQRTESGANQYPG